MIKLSKGETRGLARLLNKTPDVGFVDMVVERRMDKGGHVVVTIQHRVPKRNGRGTYAAVDATVIGPRGGHYTA